LGIGISAWNREEFNFLNVNGLTLGKEGEVGLLNGGFEVFGAGASNKLVPFR
jgi:hypothetical protein